MPKRKAPFPDFNGQPLYEGDVIEHPVDKERGVIFVDPAKVSKDAPNLEWRVRYEDCPDLWLGLQIGDKGRAVRVTPAPRETYPISLRHLQALKHVVKYANQRLFLIGHTGSREAVEHRKAVREAREALEIIKQLRKDFNR